MYWLIIGAVALVQSASCAYDSNYELSVAEKYVYFSGAAYCADPRFKKSGVEEWTCKACQKYPGVDATVFSSSRDGVGYVGYYPDDNEIIIAFSGTNPFDIQEWIDDLDFLKMDYPYCDGCNVHEGFYKTYLSVSDQVWNLTSAYLSEHPSATVTCTGHSLGAALASHCAADLSYKGIAATMTTAYTYGMPRVGDEAFEKWYIETVPGTFRVVHRKDPVPRMFPQNMGFHHMAYEVFYEKDKNDWKLCSIEGEDETCANQYTVSLDVLNHLDYLDFSFTTNWIDCEL
mmetsp:Transcript_1338/g.2168  ORF Transcript_1338/g.2168 Transcript_1338/m.2168 type:complete len:287 (+) Transcript_1338:84-944(+)|eukprot:CAMPEP_0185018188 /NCGR_PEP_ID=MMETSP1103-20130426/992_1 /TAXON_ID=36769 /ORGANISM="Paraphysomonas bandaiensis, Strain Caron Lab Isolate" /LENGTH=286 /DNA_ID=CAMNT_0027547911 /DNA_START=84 /DNA_END=944 /DNA_ORIENTATION=+